MSQTDRTTGLVGHLGIKAPVRAATTANITLSGLQTVDGVVLVADDRVLVKNQTTGSENGIYAADTGTWERAKDFNGVYDIVKGTMARVTDGSTLSDSYWAVSTANPITIGTTAITFTQVNNALTGVSAFIATLLDDATAAAARATLLIETTSTVASAASPDIWTGTGHLIDYTGTTAASSFPAAPQAGAARELLCAAAPRFTNGADFVIAGGNFTAAAGDRILVVAETTTRFRLYPLLSQRLFSTGDVKLTIKTVADPSWVMCNDGTIGNAASGGTTRANADTVDLFTLLWNNVADAQCPVSGGRGANAAADYAANKTITLPLMLGRALASAGAGAGLSSRVLALTTGTESVAAGTAGLYTLVLAEIPPHAHQQDINTALVAPGPTPATGNNTGVIGGATQATGGGGAHGHTTPSHSLMQPSTFLNIMIKL